MQNLVLLCNLVVGQSPGPLEQRVFIHCRSSEQGNTKSLGSCSGL